MSEHRLKVIENDEAMPSFEHPASHDRAAPQEIYLCGKCGIIVERGVAPQVLRYSVIRCPNCGVRNRLPRFDLDDTVVNGETISLYRMQRDR